jgi:glycosyltransferase involved in cell wall biosynthesis
MTARLRVAFLSSVHPHPWAPTKGTFNRVLLEGLAKSVDLHAIVPVPWTERRAPRTTIHAPYPLLTPTWWYLPRVAPLALAGALHRSLRATLRDIPPPDVVLSYWADPDGTVAVRWAEALGCPAALMVGGSDAMLLAAQGPRRARILDTLQRAGRVFTIGRRIREVLLASGIPPERLEVFARGVDRSRFHPGDQASARARLQLPSGRTILLWVGRMVPVKGLDVLLTAMADPSLGVLRPLLVLIGDGPERARLMAQAAALGLVDQVRWIGRVGHEALPDWYRAADLQVLASHSEGVPNVLLEGLACGTSFVATDVGSVSDLAQEPDAMLVPPGDPSALAARVARTLAHRAPIGLRPIPDADEAAAALGMRLAELASASAHRASSTMP